MKACVIVNKYHFIGIRCRNDALARVLHDIGHTVQGSDITAGCLQRALRKKYKDTSFSEDNVVEGFTYIAGNAFKDESEIKSKRKGYEVIRYHIPRTL